MRNPGTGSAANRRAPAVMSPRALWAIGCGQLVNWGVLFFAFGVLLVPLESALDAPRWLVTGAFSLGLLISAIAAPAVGRIADRGQGPVVMQAGGFVAAGLLMVWAAVPTLATTYAVWAGLGCCMAAILYEPVFAIVGRAFDDGEARLRAIATVTVMGGLASTVFIPGTALLVARAGWRATVVVLAVILAMTTLIVTRLAFRAQQVSALDLRNAMVGGGGGAPPGNVPSLYRYISVFSLSSVVNSAVAANIVAALIERDLSPGRASLIAGMFGVMQLPGRLLMTNRAFTPAPAPLLITSFGLQIAGLLTLMLNFEAAWWLGVMLFASGAGLTTLARPYLVLHVYGSARAGYINGLIARGQQLARAAGPVTAGAMAGATGYPRVFAALSLLLVTAIVFTPTRRL
jgi:MFS family permease